MSPTPEQLRENGAVPFEMISYDQVHQIICDPVIQLIGRVSGRWFGRLNALEWRGLLVKGEEGASPSVATAHPLVCTSGGDYFVLAGNSFQEAFPVHLKRDSVEEGKIGGEGTVDWGGDMGLIDCVIEEGISSDFELEEGDIVLFFSKQRCDKLWIHALCGGNGVMVENLRTALNNASGGGLDDIGPEP